MHIQPSSRFIMRVRKLVKRNSSLSRVIDERLVQFRKDPQNPILRVHKLTGYKQETWSFSVGYDLRILFVVEGDDITLVDIGTHNQVY